VLVRKTGELMSQLIEKYLDDTARQREWPTKTVLRKRGELREFLEIVGDKPINQLQRIAAGYSSRAQFLTDLTLDPPSASSDEAGPPTRDEDYLILSTIHSAKGQEWKSVSILTAVDGCIPSDLGTGCTEDIEEERRLLYVAMTRAKDQLMLMVPQRFYTHQQASRGDKHLYAARTRFIPSALLKHFEQRTWPAATDGDKRSAVHASDGAVDLGARMRGMWRHAAT
jgi:DNA helicase-2/ATP-dependent DNA helicase PcrA